MKLKIDGMSCQHCVNRVKKALEGIDGVESALVDLGKGEADVVVSSAIKPEVLIEAVEGAGYRAHLLE